MIVNWNTRALLQDCLGSIFDSGNDLALEVIVVDNASTDDSVSMVQEKFPQVRLILSAENIGFARANNVAIPTCTAPLIALVNSDVRVLPGALHTLIKYMEDNPGAGAIGPRVINLSRSRALLSGGCLPTPRRLFNQYFFLSRLFPNRSSCLGLSLLQGIHDQEVREVEWLSGVFFVVRRAVIDSVGMFDTRWFMYAEDMEWSHRIRQAGWQIFHVPEAVVEHHVQASTRQNQQVKTMWIDSMREFYVQAFRPSSYQLLSFDMVLISGMALRFAYHRLRQHLRSGETADARSEADRFGAYTRAAYLAARRSAPRPTVG